MVHDIITASEVEKIQTSTSNCRQKQTGKPVRLICAYTAFRILSVDLFTVSLNAIAALISVIYCTRTNNSNYEASLHF